MASTGRVIRKRDRYTRLRAKRSRPRTAAPKTGWLLAELTALTGLSVRTLRYYVQVGLIQPLELRGTATRYSRRELLRLLYTLRMKAAPGSTLKAMKKKLDALDDSELEAWLIRQPVAPHILEVLGLKARSAVPAPPVTDGALAASTMSADTWQRVRLLPGLELMVSSDASMAVKGVAQQICALALGYRS